MRHIPNGLTCVSLSFGFFASIAAASGNYKTALIAILIAAVFDFTDGFAARILNAYSPIGKELDSLADLVSFGVAPGMMLFSFAKQLLRELPFEGIWIKLFLLPAFIIPAFSALRLAKFNTQTSRSSSFIGLPVPAHAIFLASLIFTLSGPDNYISDISPFSLLTAISILAILTSLLLISDIPMFSLKLSSLSWKENKYRYILMLSAIILTLCFGTIGLSATILLYIIMSVLVNKKIGNGVNTV